MIDRSLKRAKARKLPYTTIIGHINFSEPVPVPGPQTFFAIVRYGDEQLICGLLNIIQRPTDASSASPPQPAQSPLAVPES